MILAFGFGLRAINSVLPAGLIYASPYNAIQSLLYTGYGGQVSLVQLSDPTTTSLQWPFMLISLLIWIGIFLAANSYPLQRLKPRQVEEGRQI